MVTNALMFSHHSHSGQFCRHGSGTLEQVVIQAISKGFTLYGLTEHVPRYRVNDLYPEEMELSPSGLMEIFDAFVNEAHRLKSVFADRITLLVGLETEYITKEDLTGLEAILKKYEGRIEYIVGSVHHVNTIPIDFDIASFKRATESFQGSTFSTSLHSQVTESLFLAYFDAQYELMRRFHPEIIGHFDLCRLYLPETRFRDYPVVWAKVERNIRYAINYGALFELNAAAFRKGWTDAYPAHDIVEAIKCLGGRFTLSDDSHGPNTVGLNYHRLQDYVKKFGLHKIWYLEYSSKPNNFGRYATPVLADVDWCNPNAWTPLS